MEINFSQNYNNIIIIPAKQEIYFAEFVFSLLHLASDAGVIPQYYCYTHLSWSWLAYHAYIKHLISNKKLTCFHARYIYQIIGRFH